MTQTSPTTPRDGNRPRVVIDLANPAATACLGVALSDVLRPGDIVALSGDLGTGKTALCRAFIRAATGVPKEDVPSPTFTLVQMYDAPGWTIWHYDLYRLEHPDDAYELDVEDAFAEGVSLIEWPDRLGSLLPQGALRLDLTVTGQTARRAYLCGHPHILDRVEKHYRALLHGREASP